MMDSEMLSASISDLWPGSVRFFEQIDSTNSAAARWADTGASDLALVVADEQTAGRGRQGRRWFTPAGAALAFSLVFRELPDAVSESEAGHTPGSFMRLTALGALAVCQALRERYALPAEIKWPNDVLVGRRKLAGILVEATWLGDQLQAAILGIGINIAPQSVPAAAELSFPATCVQEALGRSLDRWELLPAVLDNLLKWKTRLNSPDFLAAWDGYLAFKGEWVRIFENDPSGGNPRQGCVLGLDDQGRLCLQDSSGEAFSLLTGALNLRPAESLRSRKEN
jgi:BirA family transcriptional regulator, biotin operon repressor / biotin---[acetyl-CoA-carboxylase] ligase